VFFFAHAHVKFCKFYTGGTFFNLMLETVLYLGDDLNFNFFSCLHKFFKHVKEGLTKRGLFVEGVRLSHQKGGAGDLIGMIGLN
jgi:hypothetical protein